MKNKLLLNASTLLLSLLVLGCRTGESAKLSDGLVKEMMNGIPNETGQERNRYFTPGDKLYIVGMQDGNFPDLGSHIEGEMGGVWNHLIKLLDGFWVRLSENGKEFVWLENADTYRTYPYGSEFHYPTVFNSIEVGRMQYCPQGKNGAVITYTLKNNSDQKKDVKLEFVAKTDLMPVWSSEQIGLRNGDDSVVWDEVLSVFTAKDNENEWYAVWGANEKALSHKVDVSTYDNTKGRGKSASSLYDISLKAGGTSKISFVITGSKNSRDEALTLFSEIVKNKEEMLQAKKEHYAEVVTRGKISIPDKKMQNVYNWCKVNTEWLVADQEGVGRYQGAGAVEYQWLFGCDNSYTMQGVAASGNHDLAESTLTVIKNMSEKANGNGRILHEMAFNAHVSHKGNTQETAHFIMAVWDVFSWTGNREFLAEVYPYMKKGIDFLLKEMDTNGNMFPEGYGIMEVSGLNAELIDVSVYTQQALEAMAKISVLMNEQELSGGYAEKATILKEKINKEFWDEKLKTYCDFYGTREQALQAVEGALSQVTDGYGEDNRNSNRDQRISIYRAIRDRIKEYPKGTQKGWLINKNWVISTPVETGIAPYERAIQMLDMVRKENCGIYGPYLAAVERMHMMTISTGVQAVAECAYGRIDESLWYVNRIVDTFGKVLPGSVTEMMPDYGCEAQAWTIYGMVVPLIKYIFGICPEAHNKTITFCPNLPSKWNEIAIEDFPIGDCLINYIVKRTEGGLEVILDTKSKNWNFRFGTLDIPVKKFVLNGKEQIL